MSKEELTTKMHSEFIISDDEDLKQRCWCALKQLQSGDWLLESVAKSFSVTPAQIESFRDEFELLTSE